ncbi:MAG: hypothetical protein M1819_005136 [Sarea resinae]|nr:MAG: hypothetical protein M1819_005136 [Sarea resinae]
MDVENVLEFWIDGEPFFGGDFYAYRKAPLVVVLEPGRHRLDVRLVRDVRAMGGMNTPVLSFNIQLRASEGRLAVLGERMIVPDIVKGRLASSLVSVPVRNEGQQWITIHSIISANDEFMVSTDLEDLAFRLAPGQARPVTFHISLIRAKSELSRTHINEEESDDNARTQTYSLSFKVGYAIDISREEHRTPITSNVLKEISIFQPHKFTFRHPSSSLSYAILRPPSKRSECARMKLENVPIILNLHGAGLEAESEPVAHAFDAIPDLCAWVLSPSGTTPWSGDDWHTWGLADVEAAIKAIEDWTRSVKWYGVGVDVKRWIVSGHSNGGQGTWHTLTHRPDNVIAAAPISAYSSIETYVPYHLWRILEPRVTSILLAATGSYRHERLVENCAGIPVLQQHGSADDNVPAFHSRLMSQLLFEAAGKSSYVEIPHEGHWFDGAMTTKPLTRFYEYFIERGNDVLTRQDRFSITIPPSGELGPRYGLLVDQLGSPDQYGKAEVEIDHKKSSWAIKTSNIHRFHFTNSSHNVEFPATVVLDGHAITLEYLSCAGEDQWFIRTVASLWEVSCGKKWQTLGERYGDQLGALDAILKSKDVFRIAVLQKSSYDVALQISRNLFQYYGADTEIIREDYVSHQHGGGNLMLVTLGSTVPSSLLETFPLRVLPDQAIAIRDSVGQERTYPLSEGTGAIFLRPLEAERLELVIWGFDKGGLQRAARLVPTLTGAGQPEFVVLGKSCAWKGVDGILALGSFDHAWNVSAASFFT